MVKTQALLLENLVMILERIRSEENPPPPSLMTKSLIRAPCGGLTGVVMVTID